MSALYRDLPWNIYFHLFRLEHIEGALDEVQHWMLVSALRRGDERTAFMYLRDWKHLTTKQVEIGTFIPGKHWHVLGTKFDTYEEAKEHAESKGYTVSRINTQRIAPVGD